MNPICIYCSRAGVPFNRDHVVPEAFGSFQQNFVLHDTVCNDCNQYFGDKLEVVLGRDSAEALLRLHLGLKPSADARHVGGERVTIRVDAPGDWHGVKVLLVPGPHGTGLDAQLIPQVAIKREGKEKEWFTEDELESIQFDESYRKKSRINIYAPTEEDTNRVVDKLRKAGVNFNKEGGLTGPLTENGRLPTQVKSHIDDLILRCIGKIAFNYVAHIQGAVFALNSSFDHFRRYVRYGENPSLSPVVVPLDKRILFDETPNERQTVGHLITFDWNKMGDGLFAQVSLFNSITYGVLLCPWYSGIYRELRSGHHFDTKTKEISALKSARIQRMSVPAGIKLRKTQS